MSRIVSRMRRFARRRRVGRYGGVIAEHRLEEAGDRAERGDVVGLVATGGPALGPALAERLLHSAVRTV